MILVASRSIFSLFSPDEETFQNALLWKNLLSRTCVNQLWKGSAPAWLSAFGEVSDCSRGFDNGHFLRHNYSSLWIAKRARVQLGGSTPG